MSKDPLDVYFHRMFGFSLARLFNLLQDQVLEIPDCWAVQFFELLNDRESFRFQVENSKRVRPTSPFCF
jgi:hypothetical protein